MTNVVASAVDKSGLPERILNQPLTNFTMQRIELAHDFYRNSNGLSKEMTRERNDGIKPENTRLTAVKTHSSEA